MRIAAISHSCVIDVNQQIYAELRADGDVDLVLITPERWSSSLRGLMASAALPGMADAVRPLPTRYAGHIHFHWYVGLGEALREFGPQVLLVDEEPYSVVTAQALAWARQLDCRFVFYTKQNLLKRYLFPFSQIQRRVLREADHALVVSEEAGQVLRARGYAGGVTVLPHGVDTDLLAPRDAEDVRQRLGIRRPVIGYVGRLAPEKGVWDLLAAAQVLERRLGPRFTFLVIGDGPVRWRLEEAAAARMPQGVFCFAGSVAHHAVPDYLNVLDVLVLPSRTQPHWKEQFGRVLVEALACGVPVVGSSSGHIPALIHDTGGGRVFTEGDADELAEVLEDLITHPEAARELAERGRRRVVERYSYPVIARTLRGALEQVAAGEGRR